MRSITTWDEPDRSPYTEFYAGALLPGLINCHCHLELSYLQGAIPAGEGFAAFARHMGAVRNRFTEEERLRAIVAADARMQHEGVVAVGDVANGMSAFAVKAKSPIHYHTFAELFGLRTSDSNHLAPLLEQPHTTLTPHSLYSVQEALFRQICSTGSAPLSIHFLESPAEEELYQRRGRLWNWYQEVGFSCDFLHYQDPTERLIRSIPRDRSLLLVHNCTLKSDTIERIMEYFTAPVYWCICPRSNKYISHSEPPIELLRHYGLNICLGTDSLASNWSLSMLEELRMIRHVPLAERLRWATQIGARALGLEDRLGSVEVGKSPGLVWLEGVDWQTMELTDRSTLRRIA